jgi:hypothetical protein
MCEERFANGFNGCGEGDKENGAKEKGLRVFSQPLVLESESLPMTATTAMGTTAATTSTVEAAAAAHSAAAMEATGGCGEAAS